MVAATATTDPMFTAVASMFKMKATLLAKADWKDAVRATVILTPAITCVTWMTVIVAVVGSLVGAPGTT